MGLCTYGPPEKSCCPVRCCAAEQGSLSRPSPKAQCPALPLSSYTLISKIAKTAFVGFLSNGFKEGGKEGTEPLLVIKFHYTLKKKKKKRSFFRKVRNKAGCTLVMMSIHPNLEQEGGKHYAVNRGQPQMPRR